MTSNITTPINLLTNNIKVTFYFQEFYIHHSIVLQGNRVGKEGDLLWKCLILNKHIQVDMMFIQVTQRPNTCALHVYIYYAPLHYYMVRHVTCRRGGFRKVPCELYHVMFSRTAKY